MMNTEPLTNMTGAVTIMFDNDWVYVMLQKLDLLLSSYI
jgi:hypothetical protein